MRLFPALTSALLLLWVTVGHSRILRLQVSREDRGVVFIERFGYEEGGFLGLKVNNFALSESAVMNSEVQDFAFVLVRQDWDSGDMTMDDKGPSMLAPDVGGSYSPADPSVAPSTECFHSRANIDGVVFRNATRMATEFHVTRGGDYRLYFSNCLSGSRVNFRLELVQYNTDESGHRDYLGVGLNTLPKWYFFFSFLFVVEACAWLYHLHTSKEYLRQVHHLVSVLLVAKTVSLIMLGVRYQNIAVNGVTEMPVEVSFLVSLFLKQVALFSVIILLGAGWSFLKPYTSTADRTALGLAFVLQLWVNVGQVVTTQMWRGSSDWEQWMRILRICDMVRCGVVLIPTILTIRTLRRTASVHGKETSLRWAGVQQWYCLVLVLYFYFSRFASSMMTMVLAKLLSWTAASESFSPFHVTLQLDSNGYMFQELAALVFYCAAGFVHRPRPPPPPLYVYRFPGLTGEESDSTTAGVRSDIDNGDQASGSRNKKQAGFASKNRSESGKVAVDSSAVAVDAGDGDDELWNASPQHASKGRLVGRHQADSSSRHFRGVARLTLVDADEESDIGEDITGHMLTPLEEVDLNDVALQ